MAAVRAASWNDVLVTDLGADARPDVALLGVRSAGSGGTRQVAVLLNSDEGRPDH
jgi:hypothetical protein